MVISTLQILSLVISVVFLDTYEAYIVEPQVRDLNQGHTLVGEDVIIECRVYSNKPEVLINWNTPFNVNSTMDRVTITTSTVAHNKTLKLYSIKSIYKLDKAKIEDRGFYYCRVSDIDNIFDNKYSYLWLPVYANNESHAINFVDKHISFDKNYPQLKVTVKAHPQPTFQWISRNNRTIDVTDTVISSKFTNYDVILKFTNFTIGDFGNYTLVAQNKFEQRKFAVPVDVTGPPFGSISFSSQSVVKCQTVAHPRPEIFWEFGDCHGLSCFSRKQPPKIHYDGRNGIGYKEHGLEVVSYFPVSAYDSGVVHCFSNNSLGSYSFRHHVYSIKKKFEVFAFDSFETTDYLEVESLFPENIEIICGVSHQNYYKEIKWYRVGRNMSLDDIRVPVVPIRVPVRSSDQYSIDTFNSVYSTISRLTVNIDTTWLKLARREFFTWIEDTQVYGTYVCKATRLDGIVDSKFIKLVQREQPVLNVASNMQNNTVQVKVGNSWKLYCDVDGYPIPFVRWFKDNTTVLSSENIKIRDNNQTVDIQNVGKKDSGTYRCIVSNRLNDTITKAVTLQVTENDLDWLLLVIIFLIIVLVVVLIFSSIRLRKDYLLNKELQEVGLANFEQGTVEYLNPKLSLEDQANFLPYLKKWEIPEKSLSLGKELGSGAFGVVYLGELQGLEDENGKQMVAVKSVNKFAGFDYVKALASELKIMVHMGRHINVVNLIGACTKDIVKRKLLVVVEYCPFGNVHEYLILNRRNFIDQRSRESDSFDWTINQESNDNCISSKGLLTWAFQVSKGMEYLASRRVLHGDLAARNILMSENNVVKIADFGLARNLYKNKVYQKKNKGPLPVKWLAVEAIGKNIFSVQSDVWSFGVVLWEFFSLGKSPYPGMQIDHTFYKLLFDGYRMEKPAYATKDLYEVMLQCWTSEPMMRPTFTELAEKIASFLEEKVVNHYLDMNSGYVNMNRKDNNQEDYLLMMSPPTFENIVSSSSKQEVSYVNLAVE